MGGKSLGRRDASRWETKLHACHCLFTCTAYTFTIMFVYSDELEVLVFGVVVICVSVLCKYHIHYHCNEYIRSQVQQEVFFERCKTQLSSLELVVAVSGRMGSGKNYITEHYLLPELAMSGSVVPMAFAEGFKTDCVVYDGLEYETVHGTKTFSSRQALQKRGREAREKYGPDIWIYHLLVRLSAMVDAGVRYVVITDVRYRNELERIQEIFSDRCVSVRIEAPERSRRRALQEANGDEAKADVLQADRSEIDLEGHRGFHFVIPNDKGDEWRLKQTITKVFQSKFYDN